MMTRSSISIAVAIVAVGAWTSAGFASDTHGKKPQADVAHAKDAPHWGYSGESAPSHWATAVPGAHACAAGSFQSPIDIAGPRTGHPMRIGYHYHPSAASVTHNGHTIQVNMQDAGGIAVNGKNYTLRQFHFHTPAENHVAGKVYPMVAHLVHQADDGSLAVVALMIEGGKAGMVDRLPRPDHAGVAANVPGDWDVAAMLPANKASFTFQGSLTTPPCSEGVQWIVLRTPAQASLSTIAAFHAAMGSNARPVNPRNDREIAVSE